jgi:hypothetical protein
MLLNSGGSNIYGFSIFCLEDAEPLDEQEDIQSSGLTTIKMAASINRLNDSLTFFNRN